MISLMSTVKLIIRLKAYYTIPDIIKYEIERIFSYIRVHDIIIQRNIVLEALY